MMSRSDSLQKLHEATPLILPSMLLCDFANLETEIRRLDAAGFQALHLDIMDGVFVPNFTYGMTIVRAVRGCTELIIDAHLMMVNPEQYVEQFVDAGADVITFHVEATDQPAELLKKIRGLDAVAGVAINPQTEVAQIEDCLEFADMVLAMTVKPGFGAQVFDESVLPKLETLREMSGSDFLLQVDGGVNSSTIKNVHQSGANMFVVGSAIFRTEDYEATRNGLRSQLGEISERI